MFTRTCELYPSVISRITFHQRNTCIKLEQHHILALSYYVLLYIFLHRVEPLLWGVEKMQICTSVGQGWLRRTARWHMRVVQLHSGKYFLRYLIMLKMLMRFFFNWAEC